MATIQYSKQLASVEDAKNLGLLSEEYDRIKDKISHFDYDDGIES